MRKLFVFSGAGISAESGVETFRDSNGLWCGFNPDEVCNIKTWTRNYEKVHAFYDARRTQLASVEPNGAHKTIAYLQDKYGVDYVEVWTQNVDDLFERAGVKDVKHVHGNIREVRCQICGKVSDIGYTKSDNECKHCGSIYLKPNVVFFGEIAPLYNDLFPTFVNAVKHPNNIILVIGTSGNVISLSTLGIRRNSLAFKIYNALAADENDLSIFDACYLHPATVSFASGMLELIEDKMNEQ